MSTGEIHRFCFVQYSFKGDTEHPVIPRRHKNSKQSSQPYVRTWESTKLLLKSAPETMTPRDVVYTTVADEIGGISKCSSSGKLPRGRQQVKDFSRYAKQQRTHNTAGQIKDDDPWLRLLGEGKKQALSRNTAFIRDVRVAPEPLCVMATDRQINDLKRFCCQPTEYKPFTVDPTFNIGEYNVTSNIGKHKG